MLGDISSSAIVAVSDLERARTFYRDTLGLMLVGEPMGVLVFRTGATQLMVYPSPHAGTNKANAVVFNASDRFRDIHAELVSKGIQFEQYELPGAIVRDGVHESGGFLMAWFKDPDGNLIHINGR